jgi:cysteine-rich repeat protein
MRVLRPFIRSSIVAAALTVVAADARADIDLTGRWHAYADVYADIVQTGTQVTVSWSETLGPQTYDYVMTGTFDQSSLNATHPGLAGISMVAYGSGATLDGTISFFISGNPNYAHRRFTRCECYDGNTVAGDGCDEECRIEPCFTCTPEPSVCSPSADSSPCDDRNDCTTGETCGAGICSGGGAVSPCVNLTGDWRILSESKYEDTRSVSETSYIQRDGVFFSPRAIGTVDLTTGDLEAVAPGGNGWCKQAFSFRATAGLDSLHYFGRHFSYASGGQTCGGMFERTVWATQCDPVAGCNLTDCSAYADGTPCADTDLCTVNETCTSGVCGGEPRCAACSYCDEAGQCDPGPRSNCSPTLDEDASKLQIVNGADNEKDRLLWSWLRGDALDVSGLDPAGPTNLTLCVFDKETSGLRYKVALLWTSACEQPPCWKGEADKWSYRNNPQPPPVMSVSPISSVSLRGGVAGRSKIQLRGEGIYLGGEDFGFLDPPLTSTLLTQLQSNRGACFEAEFGVLGAKRNDDKVFRAKGGASPAP